MTEKHLPLSSQNVAPSQTVYPQNISAKQDILPSAEATGDEDYTIDCICPYTDDDGNTVFCDNCQTWQHIECFYPNNAQDAARDDFDHSCHRCNPRPLDVQRAKEYQAARRRDAAEREQQAATQQKSKKAPSKSHKKKAKPGDILTNGHSTGADSKPSQDLPPPAKKAKNSHKASQSISSTKRSPSNGTNRANHHPPSPAKTPPDLPDDFELYSYSDNFLKSEDNATITQFNTNASLSVTSTIATWLREPAECMKATGHSLEDVFQPMPADIEDRRKHPPKIENRSMSHSPDKKCLVTTTAVNKDTPLMELTGIIGVQKDYCEDPKNRWEEISSPLPFVFFHPMLPLYIDTRLEGSQARYVRRSCDHNAVLDTFLSDGSEYQFWIVSEKPIAANEQITLPWDLRLAKDAGARIMRLLGLSEDKATGQDDEIDEAEYNSIDNWLRILLAEHGGCACGRDGNCAFARFHRNFLGKLQARSMPPNPPKKKGRAKSKAQAISPTSTGPATNSRAPSEGQQDENHDHDGRSTSGSRSKPPSRDLTPARQGSFDTLGILTEPTDRDKRKVAMVEDAFRRQEQQPRKKKPRISDGATSGSTGQTTAGTSTTSKKGRNSTSQASGQNTTSKYVDASTSGSKPGSKSGSPMAAMSTNLSKPPMSRGASKGESAKTSRQASIAGALYPTRPQYRDAGNQTDLPYDDGLLNHYNHRTIRPRRTPVSLNKLIMENNRNMRAEIARKEAREAEIAAQQAAAQQLGPTPMELDTHVEQLISPPSSLLTDLQLSQGSSEDAPMPDADGPPKPAPISTVSVPGLGPLKTTSPELRVTLPPVPAFNASTSAVSATTPLSASPVIQSPFGTVMNSPFGLSTVVNGIAPSPVKKKLSLSDYTRKHKAAAANRPSVGTNLKPNASHPDDPKSASSVEMAVDSPVVDKPADATDPAAPAATPTTAPVNGAL